MVGVDEGFVGFGREGLFNGGGWGVWINKYIWAVYTLWGWVE